MSSTDAKTVGEWQVVSRGICRSTTLSERLATMRSMSVDHDGASCKILEATPIH
jgi:hypothetical protein